MESEKLNLWTAKFNNCLVLEFSDPAYFRVHHILVAAFMLQTGRYASSYKEKACVLLKEFLADPLTPPSKAKITEISSALSSDKRHDNVFNKKPGELIDTPITILDVSTDSAEQYRSDVIAWATSVLYEAMRVLK